MKCIITSAVPDEMLHYEAFHLGLHVCQSTNVRIVHIQKAKYGRGKLGQLQI